jgi:hypothetical protein
VDLSSTPQPIGPSHPAPPFKEASRWWRLLWGAGIVYIAAIGIFAIEELQRREETRALLRARVSDIAAAVVAVGNGPDSQTAAKRAELERELARTHDLERRLTALIVSGSVRTAAMREGSLRQIICEFTTIDRPTGQCDLGRGTVRDVFGYLVLKRPAESTASGDILAILVVVAALGGALVRLYLPGAEREDSFRMVMRAIGGGVVCYLAISGGTLVPTDVGLTTVKSPATASLLGFLSGMFATRVFELISDLVDSWIVKLSPAKPGSTPPIPKRET